MATFLLRKSVRLALLLAAVSVASFLLVSASPVDPVNAYIGADLARVSPEQRVLIARRWGLDEPPVTRYVRWAGQVLQGNLGTSQVFNQPVAEVIGQRFLVSLGLMAVAWVLSGLLGVTLGVLAGTWPNSWFDRVIRFYTYTLASTPAFWLALLLLIVFSVSLRVTPICCATPPGALSEQVTFWQRLHHLLLPAVTLGVIGAAGVTLHTRQKLIEVMQSDYMLFARAQGETTWGLVRQHGLRNIALPAITLQFAAFSELFAGSVLAEQVFSYPGLGQATVQAGVRSDVPLLLGIVLFSTLFVFAGNTLADLAYRVVDPRMAAGEHA